MLLAIYTRDESGIITYKGDEDWESRGQMLAYHCRGDEPTEVEQLVGWPHTAVTWHGDTGIAQ